MNYIKGLFIIAIAGMIACAPKVAKETTTDGDFRSMAPKSGEARPVKIGKSHEFTLDNGLKVIVVENHKLPQISYQLTIDRDVMLEKEKSGLASMAGTLLATGTTKKSKAEIDEAIDFIGANLSTNARGGFASSLTKHTDKVLALFSEVILQPSFPEDEFDKIKTQTLSGLQTSKDDPNAISGNVSSALTYGKDHPYGEITNESTVSNISLDDCKAYYNTYFKPGDAYLIIVGDISPDQAKAKADRYFGKWAAGNTPEYTYDFPKGVDKTSVAFVDKAGAVQSVINITYALDLKPGTEDVIPARVMNTILGSGFSGRLFQNLREDKAYTYGAYSSLSSDELVGTFSANASVRNEVTDSAVTQFLYELNRLKDEPVTQEELDLAKSYIAGGFARSLESPQTVASFALNINMYDLPADYYETYLQRLDAVSVEDISRVAKKYITPMNARIIVVGNKDEVMEKLVPFDLEDGKIQLYDIYANPRKDDSGPVDITAAELVDKYLMAIGGKDKVDGVNTLDQTYSLEMMGMELTSRSVMSEGKFFMNMTAPGMNIMTQKYDGEKARVEQMGQAPMDIEGDDLVSMKEQSMLFPERYYGNDGYMAEVTGIEDVDGTACYKLAVTKPSGTKSTEYYAKDSFLKIKEIQVAEADASGQAATTSFDYADYKAVEGIMIPHTVTMSGAMPTPIVMKATSVKVNGEVDPALFKL